jgi:hypothetical protein
VVAGPLPDALTVDADPKRGILALTDGGTSVAVLSWTGKVLAHVPLPDQVSNLCWLDGQEFAVTPRFAAHAVEVWNTQTRTLVRRMAPVPAIVRPARGAALARTTLLRYDSKRSELVAIDAVKGTVRVLARDGSMVRSATLPEAPGLGPWLQQIDAEARKSGQSNTPSIWHYAAMTISDDGTVWIGEEYDDKVVRAAKVTRAGKVEHLTMQEPCPSLRFEAWQGHFIFYHDPRSPRPPCVGVRRQ